MELKNKHSIATITQLRSAHIPLFSYLSSRALMSSPDCKSNAGPETADHFLFICLIHSHHRLKLKDIIEKLKIPFNKSILHDPEAFPAVADFVGNTWRLKSRWEWAETNLERTPTDQEPPD
ncbi:hypothetical protein CROQUDRAFT_91084 [Cronartium quercuum f. sp. fusiforme G11]|uniref:Uncharacterized protein n=1 Tax=Cronartium quercuum f. sp. fusiforme G11 TaxID=708437 RepID=A0A9P6NQL8_9BASI|nr:hypothetical protein CROQUDRAFT_91084 [Cronartium quercuum f. sp. fusiforme G11]